MTKPADQHTTGPVRAGTMRMNMANWKQLHAPDGIAIIQRGMNVLAVVWDIDDLDRLEDVAAQANARRLAACWNACEGMTTEALEKMPAPFDRMLSGPTIAELQTSGHLPKHRAEVERDILLQALRDIEGSHADSTAKGLRQIARRAIAMITPTTDADESN